MIIRKFWMSSLISLLNQFEPNCSRTMPPFRYEGSTFGHMLRTLSKSGGFFTLFSRFRHKMILSAARVRSTSIKLSIWGPTRVWRITISDHFSAKKWFSWFFCVFCRLGLQGYGLTEHKSSVCAKFLRTKVSTLSTRHRIVLKECLFFSRRIFFNLSLTPKSIHNVCLFVLK